jgi:hypothetical protein
MAGAVWEAVGVAATERRFSAFFGGRRVVACPVDKAVRRANVVRGAPASRRLCQASPPGTLLGETPSRARETRALLGPQIARILGRRARLAKERALSNTLS